MPDSLTGIRGGVSITITWDGTDGWIIDEDSGKTSNLSPLPLIGYDSDETDVFDFGGAMNAITLRCIKQDTLANLRTFVRTKLWPLVDGDQDTSGNMIYTGPLQENSSVGTHATIP